MPFGCEVVMTDESRYTFQRGYQKTTCDNFCIGVEFGRMPMKDLLVLVGIIPKNLKVFSQLTPKFDTDKRENNTLQFPIKTVTVSH